MPLLLTDKEINEIRLEWLSHPLPRKFENLINASSKAQLKKVVELFRQQEGEKITDTTYYRISERLLQAVLKEIE